MKENKDDELFRRNGTLLRDIAPPFNVHGTFKGHNDFISSEVSVLPLSNGSTIQKGEKNRDEIIFNLCFVFSL